MENPASNPAAAKTIGACLTIFRDGPEIGAQAASIYSGLTRDSSLTEQGQKHGAAVKAIIIKVLNEILDEERLPADQRPIGLSVQMRVYNALKKAEYVE